jgi:hypothetical protein
MTFVLVYSSHAGDTPPIRYSENKREREPAFGSFALTLLYKSFE